MATVSLQSCKASSLAPHAGTAIAATKKFPPAPLFLNPTPSFASNVGRHASLSRAQSSTFHAPSTWRCQAADGVTATVDEVEAVEEASSPAVEPSVGASENSSVASSALFQVDSAIELDLKANGFRSTRRTKLICTIGPACCAPEQIEALAAGGMNVARLNMCHGSKAWHRDVIRTVRRLNEEKGYCVAVMMDTEGSEIHMGGLGGDNAKRAEDGAIWNFTVRSYGPEDEMPPNTVQVNYDGFVDDVIQGDEISVDGGMVRFEVLSKIGPDVQLKVTDPGLLLPRANLTFFRNGQLVRARNAMLPTISSKDWLDIDFGISEGIDFLAVSFVKSPDVLTHLRSYVKARSPTRYIGLIAKIESSDSIPRLHDIISVSDGAMVARGDLGAQIPLELVPAVQQAVVHKCRELNKPVIVASQLLESMIEFPTPTRAEVADVSEVVRQRADALMLSGESAMGLYPQKALEVLRQVSLRMESWCRQDTEAIVTQNEEEEEECVVEGRGWGGVGCPPPPPPPPLPLPLQQLPHLSHALNDLISEELCRSAAQMARKLRADAIFVYTRRGYMASLLSRCRPDCPIFAFTASQDVRQRLNLYWGLIPFLMDFSDDNMEDNLQRTFRLLKARGMLKSGDLIISVTAPAGGIPSSTAHQDHERDTRSPSGDLAAGSGKPSIQIRKVP